MENYLQRIQELEVELRTLKEKRKQLKKSIINTNKKDFDRKLPFKEGDVVLFSGFEVIIAVIRERADIHDDVAYNINDDMNLSHSRIREATEEEIKMLGNRKFLIL